MYVRSRRSLLACAAILVANDVMPRVGLARPSTPAADDGGTYDTRSGGRASTAVPGPASSRSGFNDGADTDIAALENRRTTLFVLEPRDKDLDPRNVRTSALASSIDTHPVRVLATGEEAFGAYAVSIDDSGDDASRAVYYLATRAENRHVVVFRLVTNLGNMEEAFASVGDLVTFNDTDPFAEVDIDEIIDLFKDASSSAGTGYMMATTPDSSTNMMPRNLAGSTGQEA